MVERGAVGWGVEGGVISVHVGYLNQITWEFHKINFGKSC